MAKRKSRTRRTSKRPPKSWWSSCVRKVRKSGSALNPKRVCGATWARKMSPTAKKRAKRRHRN